MPISDIVQLEMGGYSACALESDRRSLSCWGSTDAGNPPAFEEDSRLPRGVRHERAPEAFVDLILADLGNPFPFDLDELGKRRLASVLVEMYRQKGTARGIINAVRFFLGVEIQAVTAYAGEALVLGESELGVD